MDTKTGEPANGTGEISTVANAGTTRRVVLSKCRRLKQGPQRVNTLEWEHVAGLGWGWAGVSEERRLTGSLSVRVIANQIQLLFLECSTHGLYQDEEARH